VEGVGGEVEANPSPPTRTGEQCKLPAGGWGWSPDPANAFWKHKEASSGWGSVAMFKLLQKMAFILGVHPPLVHPLLPTSLMSENMLFCHTL